MSYPRAVLFDHDGTLVDTEPQWAAAKRHVAGTHQQSWDTEDDHATLGGTVQDAARLMVERGATDSVEEITRQLAEHVIGSMDHEVPFLPGIPSLLRELKEAGTPAAIVTNALGSVARTTSAGAPDVLTRIVSHDDVSRAKPDPEPYLAGARLLGVPPRDCVAMEDSEPGVESAVAAGMTVVVVPGDKPVPEGPHRVFVDAHEDVTLDFLRSLTPPA
ncbi:HAD family phosphatase [Glutamicibacter protophormiae]|uniref:Phosphorylated carbohydrates phosphatase n=1 Tax=Kocuria varians TaxID=1272 RepID=A0A7D7KYQ9_KOCVA|nr:MULTISPECIES: HAD family phosphatase [Kocuria]QMS55595.1 Phosphorylated carbohydrates phosphatase [Kocuria varians]RUP84387.1 HAD family phosphatase [Kocuria sp. HSID17590]RUQ08168.1 HAD family phosphatase [Kocuria sp. HSID17582]WNB88895.1 HAD family phosphatase [Glutamicibacter protophormiae]